MKKHIALLLCAFALLVFTACGSSEEITPTEAAAPATSEATVPAVTPEDTVPAATKARTQLENTVIFDNDTASFVITEVEDSAHLGTQLHVRCINKGDRALMFSWDMVSVCGYMYDPLWSTEVAAGKTANSTIDLDTYTLEKMGITSIDEITFTLRISDSENWMEAPVAEEAFTVYPTGLTADTLVLPRRPESPDQAVIAQDDNIRFVIEQAGNGASAYTLQVYMENNTDRNLMYSWDLVSVNGNMIDPFWAKSITAGNRAVSEITFYRSDLEANGITHVSDISFKLIVSDYDNWDAPNLLEQVYTYNP